MKRAGDRREKIIVFSLIGIILIICLGSLVYIFLNNSGITGFAVSSERAADNLKFQRYICMKELSVQGFNTYNSNEDAIENFVSSNIKDCMNPIIRKYGKSFAINSSLQSLNIQITESLMNITADFPITLTENNATENLGSNFSLMINMSISKL